MPQHTFQYPGVFTLENREALHQPVIAYHTYGQLNAQKDNVVWVCHALTANSDVVDWWSGLVGPGKWIDPARHFIVCANMLGSCYGSTGPTSVNPATGQPYYHSFPQVTIRDMVQAHVALRNHLGIERIALGIAGSLGGHQLLEWLLAEPTVFTHAALIATSARHSPWGIAFNESQRWAIEQDVTWQQNHSKAGLEGLKLARAIAMISYRSHAGYLQTQLDSPEKTDDFAASSYQRYQGEKLAKRFNAFSYWYLSKAMDSHNIARGRHDDVRQVLAQITTPVLALGIRTDLLFPISEQQYIARHVQQGQFVPIDSMYGHDGFLLEYEQIGRALQQFVPNLVSGAAYTGYST